MCRARKDGQLDRQGIAGLSSEVIRARDEQREEGLREVSQPPKLCV
jgi:hypothetical protein